MEAIISDSVCRIYADTHVYKGIEGVIGGLSRVLAICHADVQVFVAVYTSIHTIVNGPKRL
jgi:hypothetical protein